MKWPVNGEPLAWALKPRKIPMMKGASDFMDL
jgi:hypothetical protein